MPDHLLPADEDGFLLRVHGDSMLGAGIHHGDLAVIRQADAAERRQIVVAIIGDPDSADEATIKRYIQHGAEARLEAEHPDWQPIDPPFRIVGIVTAGIMRRLSLAAECGSGAFGFSAESR